MDQPHNIPVTFARSVSRKVNVEVDKLIDFELTNIQPMRNHPSGGAIQTEALIATVVTATVLLIIAIAVILVLNG